MRSKGDVTASPSLPPFATGCCVLLLPWLPVDATVVTAAVASSTKSTDVSVSDTACTSSFPRGDHLTAAMASAPVLCLALLLALSLAAAFKPLALRMIGGFGFRAPASKPPASKKVVVTVSAAPVPSSAFINLYRWGTASLSQRSR